MASPVFARQSERLPKEPIDRVVEPLARFVHVQSASGVVLLAATLAALGLANSPWAGEFQAFWNTPVGFSLGDAELNHSLKHWINDGLMVLFFFVVGLEVKRELTRGELQDLRTAALPIAAALGGMLVPAAIYLALQWGQPGHRGWGIPMATDIAFVVGCLALLGSRVPPGLRILLLSLAIADDIGAILVIAIGYTSDLNLIALGWGALGIVLVMLLRKAGVRSIPIYTVLGVAIWFGFHESGVHATIAGVILGLMTPVEPWVSQNRLRAFLDDVGDFLTGEPDEDESRVKEERQSVLRSMELAARETIAPLERLETTLHPWVSFGIMPVFALANAGVAIDPASLSHPVSVAVAAGLVIGKPAGIVLFSWLAVRSGLAKLPAGVSWTVLAAGGVLAGIGFTMSLFIGGLALTGELLDAAKAGILIGSLIAAVLGMGLLRYWLPAASRPRE